jgi:hypothetical protein
MQLDHRETNKLTALEQSPKGWEDAMTSIAPRRGPLRERASLGISFRRRSTTLVDNEKIDEKGSGN